MYHSWTAMLPFLVNPYRSPFQVVGRTKPTQRHVSIALDMVMDPSVAACEGELISTLRFTQASHGRA